jgi:hypothetical protein
MTIISRLFAYTRHYFQEICYMTDTTCKAIGKELFTTIYAHPRKVKHDTPKMRIIQQNPSIQWPQVWKNLHTLLINDGIRSTCYRTFRDLIPTQTRLFRIHRQPSSACTHYMTPDILTHRLTACK